MGKQIRFYQLDQDVSSFLHYVDASCELELIRDQRYDSSEPRTIRIQEFPLTGDVSEPLLYYLRNKAIPGGINLSLVTPYDKSKPSFYSLDRTDSLVIEYCRCLLKGTVLTEGRIWVETSIPIEGGGIEKKPVAFMNWYNGMTRWFRKHFKRVQDRANQHVYVGPAAFQWAQHDGELQKVERRSLGNAPSNI